MAYVYVLYSASADKFYIGSCNILEERLRRHKEKFFQKNFTAQKGENDWELFYSIDGLGYEQARKIEEHVKSMKSRNYIINLQKYPEISEKLKERFQ
jgi:putative endonuclease